MPVQRGADTEGSFYRWGDSGKKYHYSQGVAGAQAAARARAARQGRAIKAQMSKRAVFSKYASENILEGVAQIAAQSIAPPDADLRLNALDAYLAGRPLVPGFDETSIGQPRRGRRVDEEAEDRAKTRQGSKLLLKALKLGMALQLDPDPEAENPVGTAARERDEATGQRMVLDRVRHASRGELSSTKTPSRSSKLSQALASTPSPSERARDIKEQHTSLSFDDTRIPKRGQSANTKHGSRLELRSTRPEDKQIAKTDDAMSVNQRYRLPQPADRGASVQDAWRKHRSYETHSDLLEGHPSAVRGD